jgi:tryptophanyl-tRNA synthetase
MANSLIEDNEKLIDKFGASKISDLKEIPDFYTFKNNLIYSHRDFDKFFEALKKGEKCAIVSGLNASGTLHLGHKIVFDTNLYFQREFDIPVFIPISDDESYVADKVDNQNQAFENSIELARELLAYGFDPKKTYFIIDQIYTNIYNLAIKFSKKINYSEIKASYGYSPDNNIGLHFYPSIQAAHILFPQEVLGIKNILVPIGPDEDTHIRICRDVAQKFGFVKPAIVHSRFLPGLDGEKMSKSKKKNNGLFLKESPIEIEKKINKYAFSGGQPTIEDHKRLGGNPDVDVSCIYLTNLFFGEEEGKKIKEEYKKGNILSSEMKKMFIKEMKSFVENFQLKLEKISEEDVKKSCLKNGMFGYYNNLADQAKN